MQCSSLPITVPRQRAEHVFTGLPQPLLVIQPDRRLIYVNPSAERFFDKALASHASQRLMSLGQLDAVQLEVLMRLSVGGSPAQAGLWFAKGLQTGWLSVSALASSIAQGTDWPAACLLLLVHLDEPGLAQRARIDALCRQCSLTNTERYVLMLLADGLAVEAAARQLGLRISTLRTHVRHLLEKTQAASLMQLVRWLGSAAPLIN